jgi:regulator of protease activity HflC (stomatin/prohibitin superfamily)
MNQYEDINSSMRRMRPIIVGVGVALVFLIIATRAIIILQPTERGVVFRKYGAGLQVDDVKGEGLNIVAPWNDVIVFEVQEQQIEEKMDVLSQDGLSITIDVSLRFRPKPDKIGYLYNAFRRDYINSFVRPELRSAVRETIGQYTPEELYATKRQEIESLIEEGTRETLDENYVELKALLFRSIELPETIQKAIEDKLKADQEAQKYSYLIEKEIKEAERIRVAAEGKAEANLILDASLTDNILREKGIEATQALANSPNAKVVVIGGGDDGLPLILGDN